MARPLRMGVDQKTLFDFRVIMGARDWSWVLLLSSCAARQNIL